ncbi:MAG: glycosyltransferase family 2 protein, partial [Sphingobacteriales bacterium]|nr:glycosyltransferase family 2 protein [Sphingobacteriales bacterium]
MKVTGITFIRNAIINDYPIVEAIKSILPMVDEMIVSIGDGEDETEALIKNINNDKIKIVHSTWDLSLRQGGKILAVETNKVMEHVSADTDWIFYIQGDEVIHEKYHSMVNAAMKKYV